MTLDEAIKREEEVAKGNETLAEFYYKEPGRNTALGDSCRECAAEHRQLAEWLKDYKWLLEQEPCDYAVSRKDAILQIQRYGVGCFDADEFSPEQYERFVINKLNELPPVYLQEPKTAYWVEYKPDYHRCSKCGIDALVKWDNLKRDNIDVLTDYCPNCGAKMLGKRGIKNDKIQQFYG